jgi:hypothetical protein
MKTGSQSELFLGDPAYPAKIAKQIQILELPS